MISPHDKVSLRAMLERILAKSEKKHREQIIGFVMGVLEFFSQETKCSDCVNFSAGLCKLCIPPEKIPTDILPVGCQQWKFDKDSIPF
jgi:hypothetical protein